MKPKEWWLLITLSVCWGGSFFFVEVALFDFQPFTLVFLRIAIAALVLVGVVYLIDGRVLNLVMQLNRRGAIGKKEAASKAAS
jgi:drug/metabolite transporter (DMT)-like permease